MPETSVTPAELIEAALHEHFPLRLTRSAIEDAQRGWPVRLSGAQRQDVARIAVEALAGAGLVVVSAEDLRLVLDLGRAMASTVHIVTPEQRTDYANARDHLQAALPERTTDHG